MTISVVIPAYNSSKYIIETLDSIRNQSVQPSEVIVVDDGCTDNTIQLVNDYVSKYNYDKICIYHMSHNSGIGVARQKGAEIAKSEYVAYLSSDDCYNPNFIEYCLPHLNKYTATYTTYYQCNEYLTPQSVFKPPIFSVRSVIEWALKKNMYVNFSSVIIPKHIFSRVAFEGSLRHGEDLIFLLDTINAKLQWCLIEEPLVYYRIHSLAGSFTQRPEEFELLWRYLRPRLENFGITRKQIQKAYITSRSHAYPSCFHKLLVKGYHLTKQVLH